MTSRVMSQVLPSLAQGTSSAEEQKGDQGMEHLPCEKKLRDLALLSLEKKGSHSNLPVPTRWFSTGWSQACMWIYDFKA